MKRTAHPAQVTVGPQGRLALPAEFRRELSIFSGDALLATVEDQRLVLEKSTAVLQRVNRRFSHIPPGVSLAEELIEERRAEGGRGKKSEAGGVPYPWSSRLLR